MTTTAVHDETLHVFLLIPVKGPLSIRLATAQLSDAYRALKAIRPDLAVLRPDRASHPFLLDLTPQAATALSDRRAAETFLRGLAVAGFQCIGALADAEQAEAVAELADLLPQPGAPGCSATDLSNYQFLVEQERLDAAWEEALAENEARDQAEVAAAWSVALTEDREFERQKELARQEAACQEAQLQADWEEALVENAARDRAQAEAAWADALLEDAAFEQAAFNRCWEEAAQENLRIDAAREKLRQERERQEQKFLAAWEEALLENAAFDAAQVEAAWEAALVHNALVDRANAAGLAAAEAARKAVLEGHDSKSPAPIRQASFQIRGDHVGCAMAPTHPSPLRVVVEARAWDIGRWREKTGPETAVEEPCTTVLEATSEEGEPVALVWGERLRSGGQVYARSSDLVLFGPMSSGAEALADGNIHAYAPVRGRLIAGAKGDTSANIVCQKFYGELVAIAGHHATQDQLPDALQGQAVRFWLEGEDIHYELLVPEPATAS